MTQYRELATQFSLDPKFLLPPMEDIQDPPAVPKITGAGQPAAGRSRVIDGYTIEEVE